LNGTNRVTRRIKGTYANRDAVEPILSIENLLVNPNNVEIHKSTVRVGKRKFVVFGYHDPSLEKNSSLELAGFTAAKEWHGEIVVVARGTRVFYLHNIPSSRSALARIAVGLCVFFHFFVHCDLLAIVLHHAVSKCMSWASHSRRNSWYDIPIALEGGQLINIYSVWRALNNRHLRYSALVYAMIRVYELIMLYEF